MISSISSLVAAKFKDDRHGALDPVRANGRLSMGALAKEIFENLTREHQHILKEAKEAGLNEKMLRVETFRFKGYQLHRIQMMR